MKRKIKKLTKDNFVIEPKEFIENFAPFKINDFVIFKSDVGTSLRIGRIETIQTSFSGNGDDVELCYYIIEIVVNDKHDISFGDSLYIEEKDVITFLNRADEILLRNLSDEIRSKALSGVFREEMVNE